MQDLMVLLLGGIVGASAGRLVGFLTLPNALHAYTRYKGLGLPLSVGERQAREQLVRNWCLVFVPAVMGIMCAVTALEAFGSGQ
jgi:hypothetical protein